MVISKLINDKKIWESFVLGQKPNVFLQSWNWGEFQKRLGKNIFRLGFWDNHQLLGLALLIREDARRGRYLACPGGPILDWGNKAVFIEFVNCLHRFSNSEGAVFVRVRPTILANEENKSLFKKFGFIDAPMHMHAETTWQLDIRPKEEELLKNMRKTTRQSIKKAIKAGVKIQISHNPNQAEILYRLETETARRQRFVPFGKKFMEEQFRIFVSDNQSALFLAYYQKRILAASLIIFYGDTAVYHYSGTSSSFSHIPASSLIQWEAIKEAKKRGCSIYNFWGIAPSADPHHRFAGVTTFKKGFGGERFDYLHAQDRPFQNRYWLTYIFETGRRILRRL